MGGHPGSARPHSGRGPQAEAATCLPVPPGAAHRPPGLQRHPRERGPGDRGPEGGPPALPSAQDVTAPRPHHLRGRAGQEPTHHARSPGLGTGRCWPRQARQAGARKRDTGPSEEPQPAGTDLWEWSIKCWSATASAVWGGLWNCPTGFCSHTTQVWPFEGTPCPGACGQTLPGAGACHLTLAPDITPQNTLACHLQESSGAPRTRTPKCA